MITCEQYPFCVLPATMDSTFTGPSGNLVTQKMCKPQTLTIWLTILKIHKQIISIKMKQTNKKNFEMQCITALSRGGDSSYQVTNMINVIMKTRDLNYSHISPSERNQVHLAPILVYPGVFLIGST